MNTVVQLRHQARTIAAGALLAVLTATASAGGYPGPAKPEFSTATLVSEVSIPGFCPTPVLGRDGKFGPGKVVAELSACTSDAMATFS